MPRLFTRTDGKGKVRNTRTRILIGLGAALTVSSAALVFQPSDTDRYSYLTTTAGTYDYTEYSSLTQQQLIDYTNDTYSGVASDDFTAVAGRPDNGTVNNTLGQFRIYCDLSHISQDDPIIHPDNPGAAHVHQFFGNTETDAFTKFNGNPGDPSDSNDIMNHGGSTCQGNVLNRSAYWTPVVYAGAEQDRKIVVPSKILLYYKSHRSYEVNPLPAGVQLFAGNVNAGGTINQTFTASDALMWGCHNETNGITVNPQNSIPTDCPADQPIRFNIQFPQCLQTDNAGDPVLTSADKVSHAATVRPEDPCPGTHPYRTPQITYLIEYADTGGTDPATWRLSSDDGYETVAGPANPGGSLHGDWLGGWNDDGIQSWIDGCFDPDVGNWTNVGVNNFAGPKNCSEGQLGSNGLFNSSGVARNFKKFENRNRVSKRGAYNDPCSGADCGGHTGHTP